MTRHESDRTDPVRRGSPAAGGGTPGDRDGATAAGPTGRSAPAASAASAASAVPDALSCA